MIVVSLAASVRTFDPESRVNAPVVVNVVVAPSNEMFVSETTKSPLTSNVVPESVVRVPDVKLSLVSLLKNCVESSKSRVLAFSADPPIATQELPSQRYMPLSEVLKTKVPWPIAVGFDENLPN